MKSLSRTLSSLLFVAMFMAMLAPAVAQTTATPQQSVNLVEDALQTGEARNGSTQSQSQSNTKQKIEATARAENASVELGARPAKRAGAAAVRPPNAVDDAQFTDPGTTVAIRVLANDSDPQNHNLKVIAVSTPGNGTATFNDSTVIYTPALGFTEIDVFTYVVSNGVLTDTAFVDAIVLPPPDSIWENDIFDPLNLGALSGQSGWSTGPGLASPIVIADPDPNRGKSVQIDAAPGQPIGVFKDVPDQNSGRHGFSFLVKVSGTTHLACEAAIEIQTDPATGWSNKARFCIGPSISVNYHPSGAETTIVALAVPGQWYLIHGELNLNTDLLDVWVDGQLQASAIPVHPGPIRALGITGEDQGGAGAVVIDEVTGVTANGAGATGPGGGTGTPGRPVHWINAAGGLWSDPANWSSRKVPAATDHAIITLGGDYIVTVDRSDTVNSLTLGAGFGTQILWIKGNGRGGSVTLTVNNDIPNSGVILQESELSGYGSNLTIVNGLLINRRILEIGQGSSGARVITGRVHNRCRVEAKHNLTFNGTFTNNAELKISAGKQMALTGSAQIFNQNGGEIGGNGMLLLSEDATLNFNRGATTGAAPVLTNSKLNFGPSATGVATLIMQGAAATSRLSGDIGAEQTVWIRGNGQPGNAVVTAPNGFTNAGAIRLESQISGYRSELVVASGTLLNTGIINVNQGTSGPRLLSGTVVNRGKVNANFNLAFQGSFTNLDTLAIASNQTMTLNGNTHVFYQNEGAIAGSGVLDLRNGAAMNFNRGATTGAAPILTNAKLNFGPSATGVATFIMQGADTTSRLSGDIGAEQTVWIRGNGQPGSAVVTAPNGFTNAGVIRLESQISGYRSELVVASGTLLNTGIINVNQGTSGPRLIAGEVENRGKVNVNFNLSLDGSFMNFDTLAIAGNWSLIATGPRFENRNGGVILGRGTLNLSNVSGATLSNAGEISPGVSPGSLGVTGNYMQTATGALRVEIGGTTAASQYDRLPVSGLATLNGALEVSVINGFRPALGNTFQILTCASRAGMFDFLHGLDLGDSLRFKVNYNATNVTLEVAPEEAITGISATNDGPTPIDSVTTFSATVTTGSNVIYVWDFGDSTSGSGATITHTYKEPGNYTAIVRATNALNSVTDTSVVNVFVVPITGLTASNNGPTMLGSATTLSASATSGSRVRYHWNFGDGATGDGPVVDHTYPAAGVYQAVVTATNAVGSLTDTTNVIISGTTVVDEGGNEGPVSFSLSQNYPNPFNPSTTIRYAIPEAGYVRLTVYNLLGEEIATLLSEKQPAGEHEVRWHAEGLLSGVYFYRLQINEFVATRKLILLQ